MSATATVRAPIAASLESRPAASRRAAPDELCVYRDRTLGMLRRYLRWSIEVGRLPSLLGGEIFRTRVTSYRVSSLEEMVIFVHDVERCLEMLPKPEQQVVAKVVLQDYTWAEAAKLLGCARSTVARRYHDALDSLSQTFLRKGLLEPLPE